MSHRPLFYLLWILKVAFLLSLMAISTLAAPGRQKKMDEGTRRNLLMTGLVGTYLANNNAYYGYYGQHGGYYGNAQHGYDFGQESGGYDAGYPHYHYIG